MVKRKIIKINEDLCNGCGLCIPNCPEGALQIIDGKVRLISDLFCDGLGACIGYCPQDAISVEEREAEPYSEEKVMQNIVKQGDNTIKAHLSHLKEHGETKFYKEALDFLKNNNIDINLAGDKLENEKPLPCGCPGSQMRELNQEEGASENKQNVSALRQWPVQLNLLPVKASFFENSHLLVASDCVAFANPNFHSQLLHGKSIVIGCPKLDDVENYKEKLTEIFKQNKIKSVTVAIMEVPCCSGMNWAVEEAVKNSGKQIPIISEVVGINGDLK